MTNKFKQVLLKGIPKRGFLQNGSQYNIETYRTENVLIVERKNTEASPWMTRYKRKSFFGILDYWAFDCWWVKGLRNKSFKVED